MKKFLVLAAALLWGSAALAQSVQQSGSVTTNTVPRWISTGVIGGTTTAADSAITNFGVTRNGADGICVSSARQSAAGRNTLCLQASTDAAAKIVLQNYGTATAQDLQFVINGTSVTIPTGGTAFVQSSGVLVSGNFPKWSGTSGLVIDSGMTAAVGTQYGLAYYTATGAIGGIAAGTNGQIPVATTSGAPNWRSLSGDVASVTSAGVLTLQSVNGVTYPSSYSANGVLYATSTTAVGSTVSSNTGYCLLSQGLSSAPIWAACASGSGSAGGSNTQVQFNSSTSLGGSANFTWVSPALTLGVAGTTSGQLALASSAGVSGTVTVQAPTATAAYNFNLPTGAGSSGLPLLSGGGGATAMTFGALSVAGGGTGGTAASGTLVDNISGFSSTGYINRTGAGTYAFSTVIPVSGGGTNLASGTSGGVLCYTAAGTLASSGALTANAVTIGGGAGVCPSTITAGTNGQLLIGQTGAAPAFTTVGTDATISSAGALTIANSAVTVAKMANAAAYSIFGNFTSGSTAPQYSTVGGLTQKASPAAGDLLLLQDQAASGQLKYATVSSVASAGSVSDIDGLTGSFTTSNGVTASGNVIGLTAARRTLPTTQRFTSGSGTYTTPANVLWIEVLMVGGGGGGAGGNSGGTGTTGVSTCWNTSGAACTTPVYSAVGGTANGGAAGGVGGSSTCNFSVTGGTGGAGAISHTTANGTGGPGGATSLGGQGYGGGGVTGDDAATNSGSGGGGGGVGTTASTPGFGGSAGGTCRFITTSPGASYTYSVGAGGTGGAAGSSAGAGGAGAAGQIYVIEHYGT